MVINLISPIHMYVCIPLSFNPFKSCLLLLLLLSLLLLLLLLFTGTVSKGCIDIDIIAWRDLDTRLLVELSFTGWVAIVGWVVGWLVCQFQGAMGVATWSLSAPGSLVILVLVFECGHQQGICWFCRSRVIWCYICIVYVNLGIQRFVCSLVTSRITFLHVFSSGSPS